jgi:hypothetical protein
VAAQDRVEFGRGHLEPLDLDEFLGPVEQEHVAIGVEAGDVAGVQPAVLVDGAERGLGHANHRDGELGAGMGTQAGLAIRIQIGVPVNDQQGHPAQAVHDGAHRRELAQVELAGLVRRDIGHQLGAFGYQARESGVGRGDGRRSGSAGCEVLHVHRHEHASGPAPASLHDLRMPGR